MKTLLLLLSITLTSLAEAQIIKVSLQASGLTCSMCSNSITKALRTLEFVEKIDVNLKTYTYEIKFKQDAKVDFDKIRQKVEKAGFSVSGFIATVNFNNVQVLHNQPVTIGGQTLVFTNVKEDLLNGIKRITILEKGFIHSKQARTNPWPTSIAGTYHVAI